MSKKPNFTPEELEFMQFATSPKGMQTTAILDEETSPEAAGNEAAFAAFAQQQEMPKEGPPWYKRYPSAIARGAIEGLINLGETFGPTGTQYERDLARQERQKLYNEYLPIGEDYGPAAIERGLKAAPTAMAVPGVGPVAMLLRSLGAGAAGEAASRANAPWWLETGAEIIPYGVPSLGKKIPTTPKNKEILEGARRLGLSEEAAAPLVQGETKQKWLSKLASKRGRTENALQNTKGELGNVYGKLSSQEVAKKALSSEEANRVIKSIQDELTKMPEGLRSQVTKDLADLANSPMTGESLINFYQDLNYYIGKGEHQLGLLKEQITNGLAKVSPQLANDFRMTNRLYSEYAKIAGRLKPNLATDLISASEAMRIPFAFFTGNYPLLVETVGEYAARKLAAEMLINPRLQNLSRKAISSLNQGKMGAAQMIWQSYIDEIKDKVPDQARNLQKADFTVFEGYNPDEADETTEKANQ